MPTWSPRLRMSWASPEMLTPSWCVSKTSTMNLPKISRMARAQCWQPSRTSSPWSNMDETRQIFDCRFFGIRATGLLGAFNIQGPQTFSKAACCDPRTGSSCFKMLGITGYRMSGGAHKKQNMHNSQSALFFSALEHSNT